MNLIYIFLVSTFVLCESDPGYNLVIGNSIDIFGNYGHLFNKSQVISYTHINDEPWKIFSENSIPVFVNASREAQFVESIPRLTIQLAENVDDLLNTYFLNFTIEGSERPWKAFMGDWRVVDILNAFGLKFELDDEHCYYALVKVTKTHRIVKMGDKTNLAAKTFISQAIESLNVSNHMEIRNFTKSYGTHYIDSYSTGNFIYQVFRYKKEGFRRLKKFLRTNHDLSLEKLRYYFSSLFLREIGDIKMASGNKNVEIWAERNLRDVQYLYSRPSLLRMNSLVVSKQMENLLDDSALIGLNLETIAPIFKNLQERLLFKETVENDLRLWENNYFLFYALERSG